jgi:hypothetical protein
MMEAKLTPIAPVGGGKLLLEVVDDPLQLDKLRRRAVIENNVDPNRLEDLRRFTVDAVLQLLLSPRSVR